MKRLIFLIVFTVLMVGCDASTSATMQKKAAPLHSESGTLAVHYIDVGQGSATLFQAHDGKNEYNILYDVGDWKRSEIVPYLEKEGIDSLDIIIISHPHADHIGQLDKVMERFDVGEVWMSGNETNTQVYDSAMEAILDNDVDYTEPRAGEDYDIGPLALSIIHPETLTGDLNADSISFRLTFGDMSFLVTGDATKPEELDMVARTRDIQADILLVGHHGSDTSSDPEFIRAVNPDIAIYSAGENNSYGHPHADVIDILLVENIEVYGTDLHGTIVVETDGSNYQVTTQKSAGEIATEGGSEILPDDDLENVGARNCIDINSATEAELTDIIHIGEARAAQLVALRPFETVADLIDISGIGEQTLADILDEEKACVGGD